MPNANITEHIEHAEHALLNENHDDLSHAILYVTLEPCVPTHEGFKVQSCSELILAAGIRHVIIGDIDYCRRIAGRGVEYLRSQGVTIRKIDAHAPVRRSLDNLRGNEAIKHKPNRKTPPKTPRSHVGLRQHRRRRKAHW
jgi:pyrimidine deaminase RibD-like protein